jgi:hypothetical protein
MKTLQISISDIEFNKFGLKEQNLAFSDLLELVSKELSKQNLSKCVELAEKYGLSSLSMEEITDEVKAVRQDAKSRN